MTVGDVMKLPCMVGAEVVAGQSGLSHPVESVNVLEYGWPTELLNRFFRDNKFDGNDLLISALSLSQELTSGLWTCVTSWDFR